MAQWNFKVVLAGDGAVGKTSIREQYMGKGFTGNYLKTIGADFASKKVNMSDNNITFQVWDLAGQESYQAVRSSFYKGTVGGLFVYDCQDPATLTNLKSWIDEAKNNSDSGILVYFIIANKVDLEESRRVSRDMGIEFCRRLEAETGIQFYHCETSAKTGINIGETFDLMAIKLLEKNNVKDLPKFKAPDGINDVRLASSSAKTASGISEKDFNELKKRIEVLEDKINSIQNILKKIVQKVQE